MHASSIPGRKSGRSTRIPASAISDQLTRTDWSFLNRARAHDIESIHPYPAKFIGDIPRTFLRELPIPADGAVLDIFCGSGTTLVEAQRVGRTAIGVDLNPIACLISRVKTAPLADGFEDAVLDVTARARALRKCALPDIPNVDHWFKPEIQAAIRTLTQTIDSDEYGAWHDQLRLALSSILVRISNQDSDTRYAAVSKSITRDQVFSAFVVAASKLQRALAGRTWNLTPAKIIERNTLELRASDIGSQVSLVITSPPYPNAYEYWLYHKYRMWWLGFDPIAVKEKEIGARAHFFKKNHHTAEHFNEQMSLSLSLVNDVLMKGGFACIVVGRSRIHGKVVDNGAAIEAIAAELGLPLVARLERPINSHRKSFNLAHANIKTETVLVLQKC